MFGQDAPQRRREQRADTLSVGTATEVGQFEIQGLEKKKASISSTAYTHDGTVGSTHDEIN